MKAYYRTNGVTIPVKITKATKTRVYAEYTSKTRGEIKKVFYKNWVGYWEEIPNPDNKYAVSGMLFIS